MALAVLHPEKVLLQKVIPRIEARTIFAPLCTTMGCIFLWFTGCAFDPLLWKVHSSAWHSLAEDLSFLISVTAEKSLLSVTGRTAQVLLACPATYPFFPGSFWCFDRPCGHRKLPIDLQN